MAARILPYFIALAVIAGCQAGTKHAMNAGEATDAANSFLGEELPQLSLDMLRIETQDMSNKWRISYHPPEGSTGGPIVIDVNKEGGQVTLISMEQ